MHNENKLFVGNLDFSIDETALSAAFAEFGTLLGTTVIQDRTTGRSRGFGFVEFGSGDDARRAIDTMNGTMLAGRALLVNVAKSREERGSSSSGARNRPHA